MKKQWLVCWLMLLAGTLSARGQDALAPLKSDAWTSAGEMLTPRCSFTATPLNDGRILIVGGNATSNSSIADSLSACELYAPQTRAITATAPLNEARFNHAAIKLADGRVLVVGGSGPTGSLTSFSNRQLKTCELYDPQTGTWSRTGDLLTSSTAHQLVMLNSGLVMKVCGATPGSYSTRICELYDPATGLWRATKMTSFSHVDPICVKLSDGRVLVSGGHTTNKGIEIYDPGSDTWTTAGTMTHTARGAKGVQLSDGQVLLAGGVTAWSSKPYPTTPLVDTYRPATKLTNPAPSMLNKRDYFQLLALPGDSVLALGGGFYSWYATARCDLYDPALKKWRPLPPLNAPRTRFEAVPVGNTFYVFGGFGDLEFGTDNSTVNRVLSSIEALAFTPPGPISPSVPIVKDDQVEVPQGIKQILRPLDNDWDPDGETLDIASAQHGQHGEVTVWYHSWAEQNVMYYEPFWPTWTGTDSFTYAVKDKTGNLTTGTVRVTVKPADHRPTGTSDYYIVMKDQARTVAAPGVMANDVDLDGQTTTVSLQKAPANGQLTLQADGSFTYFPNVGYVGKDAFAYALADAAGNVAAAVTTVTLNVRTFNTPPYAYNSIQNVATGVPFVVFSLAGYDPDGDTLSFSIVKQPAHGRLSGTTGHMRYHPDAGYGGYDEIQFKANDGLADSNIATVAITVQGGNRAPLAYDGSYTVTTGQSVAVKMTAYDADNDPLTWSIIGPPLHGTIEGMAPNVLYTPAPGFTGVDKISFKVNDGKADSNNAGITITVVAAPNKPPVAVDSSAEGDEDTLIPVMLNATDPENDPLTYRVVVPPVHGWLSGNGPLMNYQPETNYNGTDSLVFRALDGQTSSSVARVNITIRPVNDAPFAYNRYVYGYEDSVLPVGLYAYDPEGDLLQYTVVTPPAHGTLSGEGKYLYYTPETNYSGSDRITYKVNDSQADSNLATVNITLWPVNDAPVTQNDDYSTDEDTALDIPAPGVMANDSDVEGDPLKAVLLQAPRHGWVTLNADGSFHYVPETNYNYAAETNYGVGDSFVYRVTETSYNPPWRSETDYLSSQPAVVNITVNPVNDAPVLGAIAVPAEPFLVGAQVSLEASFGDVDLGDTHEATWNWGDGTTSAGTVEETAGRVTGTHAYGAAGLYTVTLTLRDQAGASDEKSCQYVIVYDPAAGRITGGGWFDAPAGTWCARPEFAGKMTANINVRYKQDESLPSGLMSLHSAGAEFQFIADSFKWLAVCGPKAVLTGCGSLNGKAGYAFLVSVYDGNSAAGKPAAGDRIRVKIWEAQTGAVAYDNQPGAADAEEPVMGLGGGNFTLH